MKVLSYLELSKETVIETGHFTEYIENKLMSFDSVADFCSQSFKPEMITELFEGWEEKEIGAGIYHCKFGSIDTTETWWEYHIYNTEEEEEYGVTICELFIPRTLDDFINDCQRAGIELEWRQ